jgi:hypothetical protein
MASKRKIKDQQSSQVDIVPVKKQPRARTANKQELTIQDPAMAVEATEPQSGYFSLYDVPGLREDAARMLISQVAYSQPVNKEGKMLLEDGPVDLLASLRPEDALESMIATQMTAVHNMAMEATQRAMINIEKPNCFDNNTNRAIKLMEVFNRQVEILQKYRTKGQQQIVVKHQQVNVGHGGQAVIGDVHQADGGDMRG